MLIVGAFRFSAHQPATLRQLADGINPTLQTLCRRGEGLIKQKPHRRPIFRARCVLGLPRQKLKPHNKRLSHVVRGHRTYHSMLLALIERFRDQPNAKHRLFGFVQKLHLPIAAQSGHSQRSYVCSVSEMIALRRPDRERAILCLPEARFSLPLWPKTVTSGPAN
jgi:hypothetical protein